jgi:hypothetical protein
VSGPARKPYRDVHAVRVEHNDLLILRTDTPLSMEEQRALDKELRTAYPDWRGALLILGVDQSVEKLPRETAEALYRELHKIFGSAEDARGS